MLEVAALANDFLFLAQTLQGLADFLAIEFVGLDFEVAQGLAVLKLQDDVGDLRKGRPGPESDQSLDGVLQRLVQALGDDRNDLGLGR